MRANGYVLSVKCASCSIDNAGVEVCVCVCVSVSAGIFPLLCPLCPELLHQVTGHIYCCFLFGKFHAVFLKRRENSREGESRDERCDGESVRESVRRTGRVL